MIHYVTTRHHKYTFAYVERKLGRSHVRRISYDRLFAQKSFAPGTYIFTDIERLDDWELRLAAELYRQLNANGPAIRVVNDPARVKCRYALLRTLREAGINRFDAYRGDEQRQPRCFPVFLREQTHHGSPLTDLLRTQEELEVNLEHFVAQGIPAGAIIIVEYAAEPIRENKFRKFGVFRVGNAIVPHHVLFEEGWLVKYGDRKRMADEDRQAEAEFIHGNPHSDQLRQAFDLARIEYGRADYGIVDGKIQIYEINTNPHITYDRVYVTDLKRETYELAEAMLLEALIALDRPSSGRRINVDSPSLAATRRNLGFLYSRRNRP